MALDYIYVHLDGISNSVLSTGINIHDYSRSVLHLPSNLLLLDPHSYQGEYERHTGLKVVRGEESVQNYLTAENRNPSVKWIDFSDINMVKQLSDLEISELLYLGHMKTNLHSPFFYKLQNNYVFLSLGEDTSKIYYRYLSEYYRVVADKICQNLMRKLNKKKSFFKKAIRVTKLDSIVIEKLRSFMQDGIVFGFEKVDGQQSTCEIPIYLLEDRLKKSTTLQLDAEDYIGSLHYSFESQTWQLKLQETEWSLIDLPKQA